MNNFQHLTRENIFYIVGFLDGDGCINGQIIQNKDYYFDHQIRVTITFYQLGKRFWLLEQFKQWLQMGTFRPYKSDNIMCDLTIAGVDEVEHFLKFFGPHILAKQKQVNLALRLL